MRAIEEAVQDELRQEKKPLTLFMLGGVDVGKTYTVTSLANRFYEHGLTVAVVDADVGQSDIGPPCCIGMGILDRKIQKLSEVPLHSLYFVGNTSPERCMHECITGAATAVQEAKKCDADLILVDSTGWIEGEDAKMFKLLEIKGIDPSLVVAIEKEDELKHILPHLHKKVIRLRISPETRSRTREERRALREEAYKSYFRAAQNSVFELSLKPLQGLRGQRGRAPLAWLPERGTLLGLFGSICEDNDEGERTLGLGILRKVDYERGKAVVFTPVNADTGDKAGIKGIKPGGVKLIKVNDEFKEFKSFHLSPYRACGVVGQSPTLSNPQTTENSDK
ncbi:MAG: Clp1/GlmU family protein [archaeon]|nr:Clp1/GlmU family protein [archaeon]